MNAFELVEPSSLGEALGLLDPDDSAVRPIAGGTALMLMMKTGLYRPRRLVSLRALGRALTIIAATPEGGLDIGAMVRLAQIERSAAVRQAAPVQPRGINTASSDVDSCLRRDRQFESTSLQRRVSKTSVPRERSGSLPRYRHPMLILYIRGGIRPV